MRIQGGAHDPDAGDTNDQSLHEVTPGDAADALVSPLRRKPITTRPLPSATSIHDQWILRVARGAQRKRADTEASSPRGPLSAALMSGRSRGKPC